MGKIWANSGDSHLMEPEDLFSEAMPAEMAARMPRSQKDPDGEYETAITARQLEDILAHHNREYRILKSELR